MPTSQLHPCGPLVSNPFGEKYLYEVNRGTFSQIDSSTLYAQQFGEGLTTPDSLHLIVGSDSGLLLNYLVQQPAGENSLYLFIEPDAVRERLDTDNLLPKMPDNIALINAGELQERLGSAHCLRYFAMEAVKLHESLAARDANLALYRQLVTEIQGAIYQRATQLRLDINVASFYKQQLQNISENRHPASCLQGLFTGKTVVILGGGPSLDPLLPWVIDNRDKLVIFAVSRVVRRLIEVELIPDIVFSIDPQDLNLGISREMLLLSDDVLFVHANYVTTRLAALWHGRNLYLGPRYPWPTATEQENLNPWTPTVTNTALGAAVAMGFARAIVIGVDFCYNSAGMTHAAGSNESDAGPKLDDTVTIETNDGNQAETSPAYFHAMGYFAEQAEQARETGCEVISPAPGAARISTVTYTPAKQLTLAPLDIAPTRQIFSTLSADTPATRTADAKIVLEELAEARRQLRKIASLAIVGVEYSRRLFKRLDGKPDAGMQHRIKKIDARLEGEFENMSIFLKHYNMRDFLKATPPNKNSSAHQIEGYYSNYFTAYQQGAEDFCGLVETANRRVMARLEEEVPQPDFKKIVEQWREDKQQWRIRVFKARRPEFVATLSAGWQKAVTTWEANAHKWLRERLDGTRPKPVPPRDLSRVRGKALNLFLQRDSGELERLFNGLEQHPDTGQTAQLQALIKGYHCELSENPDEALECYQMLITDDITPLTEEALRRISVVALERKNLEMAQLALECLSNVSVSYQPRYADLLSAMGQYQQAADHYTAYLQTVPADLAVLIKLGKTYRAMGAEEAAQTAFKLVLEQDPDNRTAQALAAEKLQQ